jgi:putative redox protein
MAIDQSAHRGVTMRRVSSTKFAITNDRGGEITVGMGDGTEFTPVDLFLAAIGACTAIDVDILTSRRAEPEAFSVAVDAEKIRDEHGNHLTDVMVTFSATFPATAAGDEARAIMPDVVRKSHDRLCTVGRTVELGTPIGTQIVQ